MLGQGFKDRTGLGFQDLCIKLIQSIVRFELDLDSLRSELSSAIDTD